MTRHLARPPGGFAWHTRAACRDLGTDAMFPETIAALFAALAALAVCAECPVRSACAAYAVSSGQLFGVWGGLSEHDLRAAVRATPVGASSVAVPAPTPFPPPRPDPRAGVGAVRARAGACATALRTTHSVPQRSERTP